VFEHSALSVPSETLTRPATTSGILATAEISGVGIEVRNSIAESKEAFCAIALAASSLFSELGCQWSARLETMV
jgi:hypothetical protein